MTKQDHALLCGQIVQSQTLYFYPFIKNIEKCQPYFVVHSCTVECHILEQFDRRCAQDCFLRQFNKPNSAIIGVLSTDQAYPTSVTYTAQENGTQRYWTTFSHDCINQQVSSRKPQAAGLFICSILILIILHAVLT